MRAEAVQNRGPSAYQPNALITARPNRLTWRGGGGGSLCLPSSHTSAETRPLSASYSTFPTVSRLLRVKLPDFSAKKNVETEKLASTPAMTVHTGSFPASAYPGFHASPTGTKEELLLAAAGVFSATALAFSTHVTLGRFLR